MSEYEREREPVCVDEREGLCVCVYIWERATVCGYEGESHCVYERASSVSV